MERRNENPPRGASNVRETRFARTGTTHGDSRPSRPKHEGAARALHVDESPRLRAAEHYDLRHIESNQIYLSIAHVEVAAVIDSAPANVPHDCIIIIIIIIIHTVRSFFSLVIYRRVRACMSRVHSEFQS